MSEENEVCRDSQPACTRYPASIASPIRSAGVHLLLPGALKSVTMELASSRQQDLAILNIFHLGFNWKVY
ncbi:hypothetical protein GDO81_015542 [Engystomops pustulosus]|uniref:Uncharacterized protein n=1 Tax=Engystomops pustulosus TaxID=76066 RepID=A0AAV7AL46_ENGPU|nr:hypothetical protein GDO81_015542 [Engystomops pustulosus]